MPELVLGPLLRHAGATDATVWVETDERCEVEVLGCSSPTFRVGDHHYALVHVTGLEPGTAREYGVRLDGTAVWPEPGSPFPPSVVGTRAEGGAVKLVFGSCRVAAPHEAPYTLDLSEDARGLGVDAMFAMAMRLRDRPPEELPDALVLLGIRSTRTNPPSTPRSSSARAATRTAPPARPSRTLLSTPASTATPGGTPRSAGSSPPSPPPWSSTTTRSATTGTSRPPGSRRYATSPTGTTRSPAATSPTWSTSTSATSPPKNSKTTICTPMSGRQRTPGPSSGRPPTRPTGTPRWPAGVTPATSGTSGCSSWTPGEEGFWTRAGAPW